MSTALVWGPARVEAFMVLHAEGLSFSIIAERMGCSRNAAIGKASRLGLVRGQAKRDPAAARAKHNYCRRVRLKAQREVVKRSAPVVSAPPMPDPVVEPRHLDLIELEFGDCRFPYGDGPFTFCGHDAGEGTYCPAHHKITSIRPARA